MKKSLAIAIATLTATLTSALSLGIPQSVEAQTRCWWEGRQMRCQNERDINNNRYDYSNRNRNDYYNQNRNRDNRYQTHNDGGYYEDWRRENYYNNNSNRNDGGYYEDWRRNNRSYNYNNGYYNSRAIDESQLRRSINDIYRQQLGRNADWDGIRHYINQYRNGWSLGQIRNDIANSNEALYRYRR
jgi:hypothetical protein